MTKYYLYVCARVINEKTGSVRAYLKKSGEETVLECIYKFLSLLRSEEGDFDLVILLICPIIWFYKSVCIRIESITVCKICFVSICGWIKNIVLILSRGRHNLEFLRSSESYKYLIRQIMSDSYAFHVDFILIGWYSCYIHINYVTFITADNELIITWYGLYVP